MATILIVYCMWLIFFFPNFISKLGAATEFKDRKLDIVAGAHGPIFIRELVTDHTRNGKPRCWIYVNT